MEAKGLASGKCGGFVSSVFATANLQDKPGPFQIKNKTGLLAKSGFAKDSQDQWLTKS
jgi:hypothetical protein